MILLLNFQNNRVNYNGKAFKGPAIEESILPNFLLEETFFSLNAVSSLSFLHLFIELFMNDSSIIMLLSGLVIKFGLLLQTTSQWV